MATGEEDLLKVLANETNQRILLALVPEPSHSRLLAETLGLNETEVSRRLKKLEKAGLVVGRWTRAEANVKRYHLAVEGMEVRFTTKGLEVQLRGAPEGSGTHYRAPVWSFDLPLTPSYVPRPAVERALLETPARVTVLLGVAGVGKTYLATMAARAHSGPVLWHTLRPTDTFGRVYHRAAAFLDLAGEKKPLELWTSGSRDPDTLLASLRESLDRVDTLIILDDYHAAKEDDVLTLVHGLIRDLRKGRLLLTSRERPRYLPPQVPHQVIPLGGFTLEEAREFLTLKGVVPEEKLLAEVHERTAGHPILLNLFAETSLARDGRGALPPSDADAQAYLWDAFYATTSEEERRVLEAASVWHSRFTRQGLAALLPGENPDYRLFSLEKRLLVERRGDEGFALHDLIRGFAYATGRDKTKLHLAAAQFSQGLGTVQGHLEAIDHYVRAREHTKAAALLTRNLDLTELDVVEQGHHALYRDVLERFSESEVPAQVWTVILDERGDLALKTGDPQGALEHYAEAAERTPAKDAEAHADLAWKQALALRGLGDLPAAREAVARGLRQAPRGGRAEGRLLALKKGLGSRDSKTTGKRASKQVLDDKP